MCVKCKGVTVRGQRSERAGFRLGIDKSKEEKGRKGEKETAGRRRRRRRVVLRTRLEKIRGD